MACQLTPLRCPLRTLGPSPLPAARLQTRMKSWAAANPACQQTLQLAKDMGWGSAKGGGEAAPPGAHVQVGPAGGPGNDCALTPSRQPACGGNLSRCIQLGSLEG